MPAGMSRSRHGHRKESLFRYPMKRDAGLPPQAMYFNKYRFSFHRQLPVRQTLNADNPYSSSVHDSRRITPSLPSL